MSLTNCPIDTENCIRHYPFCALTDPFITVKKTGKSTKRSFRAACSIKSKAILE